MPEMEFIHFSRRQLPTPFWFVYSLSGALQRDARAWANLTISMKPTPLTKKVSSYGLQIMAPAGYIYIYIYIYRWRVVNYPQSNIMMLNCADTI